MGFNSSEDVEPMSYNFEREGQGKADIADPSPLQIAAYWGAHDDMLRAGSRTTTDFATRLDAAQFVENPETDTPEKQAKRIEAAREIEDEFREWIRRSAVEKLNERRKLISNVCSGDPAVEQLEALPARIFDGFERYIQEEISPLGSTAATKQ